MELFGWSFSEQTLFFLFILGIAMLMLVFSRNRKYNIQTIAAIGKELESALRPNDQTYTWLGGSVGFKAEYQTPKPLRKAEATVTMLSRQSLLFYPISKIMFGHDRLFVVLYPIEKFRREAHLLERRYYTFRLRTLDNEASFIRKTVELRGKTFDLFSSDHAGIETLSAWLNALPDPTLVKHVAFTPENGSVYLYMTPHLTAIAPTITSLAALIGKK